MDGFHNKHIYMIFAIKRDFWIFSQTPDKIKKKIDFYMKIQNDNDFIFFFLKLDGWEAPTNIIMTLREQICHGAHTRRIQEHADEE